MKLLAGPLLAAYLSAQSPQGSFLGELETPAGKLRIGLLLNAAGDSVTAEVISIDQGYAKIPATEVQLAGQILTISLPIVSASFRGEFREDFGQLRGKFIQGAEYDLVLERVPKIPELRRPQTPHSPFPYTAADIRFPSATKGIELAGTFTIPPGDGPLAAVVLLSGSGPQDRDETLLGHKPFWVLADFLTRHGIAVLRYDDRGTAKSGGSFFGATSEDFAQDALGAVAYLRTRPEIDPARIAIVGHSEGGLLAPMVAVADPALAAIALLAAPGVRGEEILKKQTYDLPRAAGLDDEKAKANAALGMAQLAQRKAADPWLAFFWDYDPAPTLAKVQCPILALNGALDMQVNADVNLPAILAANPKAIIKKLEKLNHLFQTAETGAGLEYGRLEETFAPSAMEILATWLKEQLAPKPKRSIEPPPPAEG